ncbi:DUF2937 family protein [Salinarimonas soli]|uniref:DUF2937 family protein n=1 Tax=Salinarimonas soli TaxID=1638099 RepID=A0A5B2VF08_9HYPH|nr:DUF2937 family protein [Salinarimonas soli]KAA2237435.1 DUF2937 family protein [Salinarimonas soli]
MTTPARIVAFGLGLAGALGASQAPEYAQQYRQRLGAAIDELRAIVTRFEADARAVSESPQGAVGRLAANPDELARRQGEGMRSTMARLDALERQRRSMDEAGSFGRIVAMVRDRDPLVARGALEVFEPAVPVTTEGAVSAAAGFGTAWIAAFLSMSGLGALVRRLRRRRRIRPEGATGW